LSNLSTAAGPQRVMEVGDESCYVGWCRCSASSDHCRRHDG